MKLTEQFRYFVHRPLSGKLWTDLHTELSTTKVSRTCLTFRTAAQADESIITAICFFWETAFNVLVRQFPSLPPSVGTGEVIEGNGRERRGY